MSVAESHSSLPNHPWFAVRVRARWEKFVASMAEDRGFEIFLPVYRVRRRWSDREKWIAMPLIPGYVFCRLPLRGRAALLTIPGVLHLVSRGPIPLLMDDAEIAAMQAAAEYGSDAQPAPFLETGRHVRVERGPLAGCQGIVAEIGERKRLVLSFGLLRRAIAVDLDRASLERGPASATPHVNQFASPAAAPPQRRLGAY
jgi:transcription antitermination factor NusG